MRIRAHLGLRRFALSFPSALGGAVCLRSKGFGYISYLGNGGYIAYGGYAGMGRAAVDRVRLRSKESAFDRQPSDIS